MHSRKNAISHSLKGIYLIQGMRFTMEENAFPDWIINSRDKDYFWLPRSHKGVTFW
jgi:hypothetical protein